MTQPDPPHTGLTVLAEDECLLALSKPAGLLTVADRYHPELPCAVELASRRFGKIWTLHRLDRMTSGVLLFARDERTHRTLSLAFQNHTVQKTYHALATGAPDWSAKRIDLPLTVDGDRRHRTRHDRPGGKPSVTNVTVLERFGGCMLLEARPETGRTHQIRAHLLAIGHPIVVDDLYGDKTPLRDKAGAVILARMGLHAYAITVAHPATGQIVEYRAPYPPDFEHALHCLRTGRPPCISTPTGAQ